MIGPGHVWRQPRELIGARHGAMRDEPARSLHPKLSLETPTAHCGQRHGQGRCCRGVAAFGCAARGRIEPTVVDSLQGPKDCNSRDCLSVSPCRKQTRHLHNPLTVYYFMTTTCRTRRAGHALDACPCGEQEHSMETGDRDRPNNFHTARSWRCSRVLTRSSCCADPGAWASSPSCSGTRCTARCACVWRRGR